MKRRLVAALAASILGAGSVAAPPAARAMDVEQALAMAEEVLATAKRAGAEWRIVDEATGSTAKSLSRILKVARKKAEAGETEEAVRLAGRVIESALLGIEQARSQADVAPVYND